MKKNNAKAVTLKKNPELLDVKLAEVKLPEINAAQLKRSQNDWVAYGEKNDFPDYLIQLGKKSTIHRSFIEKRQELIKSEGLTYSDDVSTFLEAINEELETVNDLIDQVATDMATLETFAVFVRYNKLKTKIVAMDYLDSSKVRPSKTLDARGRVQGFWVCADWSNTRENEPQYFEKFNPGKIGQTTQLFFYSRTALGQPYLPEVSYLAGLHYIELAYQLSIYGLNTVLNGFHPAGILEISASMSEDEKRAEMARLYQHFTGSENASKLMVLIGEQAGMTKFNPVSSVDLTPMLNALRDMCIQEICSAHRGNPIVAAVQADGSTLGSDGKLYRDSLEIYYNTVIRQLQKPVLTFIEKVLKFNGATDFELDITSSALMTNTEVPIWKTDYLKPEVWLSEQGYTVDDIKEEWLDENGEVKDAENVPTESDVLPADTDTTPEV